MDRNQLTDRKTALGAAAGVTLAVVGAVSALFMTLDQPADAAANTTPAVEYVDQYGNPLGAEPTSAASPDVVFVNPDGTLVDASAPVAAEAGAYGEGEYEDHDEDEHGEAEYGEEMEYDEGAEHEEYDEHGEEMEDADDYEDGDDEADEAEYDEHGEEMEEDDDYEDGDYEDDEEEDEDDD